MRPWYTAAGSRGGAAVLVTVLAAITAGCGAYAEGGGGSATAGGRLKVVAAENFWGSIASQLGGSRADVQSIVVNPNTDPHSYEPTAQDARTMAGARLAIVTGLGYDGWASRTLEAGPASDRVVLNVGDVLGLKEGENPHRWYYPAGVRDVIAQITADYQRLDPASAAYFAARRKAFEATGLARYDRLRAGIRRAYAGVPVGYSESIFQGLGEDLHLRLLTPSSFAKAISEGSEVTAQDKRTVDQLVQRKKIAVWVFNGQNTTPEVQRVNELARGAGIPIATVTETLAPASDSFQRWQSRELEVLAKALRAATGR